MPPKPPVRLPTRAIPAVKAKIVPSNPAPRIQRSPPKLTTSPPKSSPPLPPSQSQTKWWQRPGARRTANVAAFSANVIAGLCAIIFIRDNFVRIDVVRGSSMAPTLSPTAHETGVEDWVVIVPYHNPAPKLRHMPDGRVEVDEVAARAAPVQINRGDVVTFWKPHNPQQIGIKRVIAVAGDTVYPKRGYALDPEVVRQARFPGVDGIPEQDKDAIGGDEELEIGKVVVPHGHVWVEGDNWRNSLDSNDFGPISRGLIEGKAVRIWRSWFDWRELGDEREKKYKTRVVKGRSGIPTIFLE